MGRKFGASLGIRRLLKEFTYLQLRNFLVFTPNLQNICSGRYPIYVETYVKCIKFWLRLLSQANDRFSKKVYDMLIHLQRQNYVTWACGVRNVLYMYGFGYVWEAQGVGDVNSFIACFRKKIDRLC